MPKERKVTALNRCTVCEKEIQLKVSASKRSMWEAVKIARCSVCLPGSKWQRTEDAE